MAKLFIEDLALKGKRVLTRVDFNVPLKGGVVESDKRLRASIPTIRYMQEKGARVVLMSHLGRPKGKPNPELSLEPVAKALSGLLDAPVAFSSTCIGPEAEKRVSELKDGEILLLENLRFHDEEEGNDPGFSRQLSTLGDIYVNDAFGTAHRAHASTEGITHHISQCASGYLMKKELDFLGDAVESPKRPFVAILGGAKISGKIDVIEALLPKVDTLIIGGGMAFTFFKAKGYEIGNSLLEAERLDMAKSLMEKAGEKLLLPVDILATEKLDFGGRSLGETKIVNSQSIPVAWEGVDIGPKTVEHYSKVIRGAQTVVWNGPMGVFEIEASSKGTYAVAGALVDATAKGAVTVIGGGDSAAAIEKAGLADKVTHVSTGGGASLEFLEGKKLPGVLALTDK